MKKPLRFIAYALLLGLTACYQDKKDQLYPAPDGGCDTTMAATYSGVVKPILQSNCALSGCHDATASGGVNLTGIAGAQTIATDGRLVGVINHASGYLPMPKDAAKLDACNILQITRWVNSGAPNN